MNAGWVPEYFRLLVPADPRQLDVQGAQLIKLANLPPSLFRYRSYPPVDASSIRRSAPEKQRQRILHEIRTGEVFLSCPDAFNDPYDSAFCILNQHLWDLAWRAKLPELLKKQKVGEYLSEGEVKQVLCSQNPLRTLGQLLLPKDPALPKEKVDSFVAFLEARLAEHVQQVLEDMGFRMREGVRVCCFSATVESVVMWSHYSSAHRGLCIEYDIGTLSRADPRLYAISPVFYAEKLFDASDYLQQARTGDANNLWLRLACLNKSAEWAYEQEWRLVLSPGPNQPSHQSIALPIKAVYLGSRVPPSTSHDVQQVTSEIGVPLRAMRMSKDSFKLMVEDT